MRYLVEGGHPWSDPVRKLIDLPHNYGEMLVGDFRRPCIVVTIIRFFPNTRQRPGLECAAGANTT
ncbi:MAG TPA: hypothetical protein VFN07_11505 [Trueperaceae bacterium]|nr:hypothetical protein [Trueperaceae bacterium]